MLKTAAAGFIFAVLPVQAPANAVAKVKQCNAPKGSST
jgi:hypothetical protein